MSTCTLHLIGGPTMTCGNEGTLKRGNGHAINAYVREFITFIIVLEYPGGEGNGIERGWCSKATLRVLRPCWGELFWCEG